MLAICLATSSSETLHLPKIPLSVLDRALELSWYMPMVPITGFKGLESTFTEALQETAVYGFFKISTYSDAEFNTLLFARGVFLNTCVYDFFAENYKKSVTTDTKLTYGTYSDSGCTRLIGNELVFTELPVRFNLDDGTYAEFGISQESSSRSTNDVVSIR
jgi:hypothetical protein